MCEGYDAKDGRFTMLDDSSTIVFQLATQFLSRIALKLEFLLQSLNQACHESHEISLAESLDQAEKNIAALHLALKTTAEMKGVSRVYHT